MPTRREFLQHTATLAATTYAGTHSAFTLAGGADAVGEARQELGPPRSAAPTKVIPVFVGAGLRAGPHDD